MPESLNIRYAGRANLGFNPLHIQPSGLLVAMSDSDPQFGSDFCEGVAEWVSSETQYAYSGLRGRHIQNRKALDMVRQQFGGGYNSDILAFHDGITSKWIVFHGNQIHLGVAGAPAGAQPLLDELINLVIGCRKSFAYAGLIRLDQVLVTPSFSNVYPELDVRSMWRPELDRLPLLEWQLVRVAGGRHLIVHGPTIEDGEYDRIHSVYPSVASALNQFPSEYV